MIISTKGRYALCVMIDIAEQNTDNYIALKDIAQRQDISEKYLESIVSILVKAKFMIGVRGKGGGYKLTKKPSEYTIGSILKLTEGSLASVSCFENKPDVCPKENQCKTACKMWETLDKLIDDFFEGITLEQLMKSSFESSPSLTFL